MIIVADSGSTKTDWRIITKDKIIPASTKGLNPYFMSPEEMIDELFQNEILHQVSPLEIQAVYFYGAGLSAQDKIEELSQTLSAFFKQAKKINVASDMLGAARAVLGNTSGVACILGTGSNSCVYNGKEIKENIPALGYVLGDEGSGADLGKYFLQAYFYGELPAEIMHDFKTFIQLTDDEIIESVYRKPLPNRFLASIAPFIAGYKHTEPVKKILNQRFLVFVEKHILPYHHPNTQIGFCGSIAYYFRNEIQTVLQQNNLSLGQVTKTPVEELVKFHVNK